MRQENLSTYFYNATTLHRERKYREAMKLYDKVLRMDPRHLDAWNNRGCIKDDLGDVDGAFEDLNTAIKICPLYDKAYHNRAYLYRAQESYDLAIRDYTMAIILNPRNSAAMEDRGQCYLQKKMYEQALEDYRKTAMLNLPECDPNEFVAFVRHDQLAKGEDIIRKIINSGYYISLRGNIKEGIIVMPRICDHRIVLPPHKLHTGKTIRRYLRQHGNRYELRFDSDFDAIFDRCQYHYNAREDDVLYLDALGHFLSVMNQNEVSPKAVGVALYKDGRLVAGELGVQIGRIYTSYTGYHDESSAGTVQLILLARFLKENGYNFLDFGPTTNGWDTYKMRLGAEKMNAKIYLSLFNSANLGYDKLLFHEGEKSQQKIA